MKDKAIHDPQGFIDVGYTEVGARIIAAVPSWAQQIAVCRRLNIDAEFICTIRVSLDPDAWVMLTKPEYAGQPFQEPGALLP